MVVKQGFLAVALLLSTSVVLAAETYDTEQNEQFTKLPQPIAAVLGKDPSVASFLKESECKVVGKAVGLADSRQPDAYIAATDHGCGWGSAGGPIWVIYGTDAKARLVLDGFGSSITLNNDSKNGLRTLSTSEGNAGTCSDSRFEYNGKQYVRVKNQNCKSRKGR